MHVVQDVVICICFYTVCCVCEQMTREGIVGNAKNRFFDKPVSCIFFDNGVMALSSDVSLSFYLIIPRSCSCCLSLALCLQCYNRLILSLVHSSVSVSSRGTNVLSHCLGPYA